MTDLIDFLVGFSECLLLIIFCSTLLTLIIVVFFLLLFKLIDYVYEKFNKENKK